jgi:hypothetical protein
MQNDRSETTPARSRQPAAEEMAMIARHLDTRDRASLRAVCRAGWNGCDIAAMSCDSPASYIVADKRVPERWTGRDVLPDDIDDRWVASADVEGGEAIRHLAAAVEAAERTPRENVQLDVGFVSITPAHRRIRFNNALSIVSIGERDETVQFACEAARMRMCGKTRTVTCGASLDETSQRDGFALALARVDAASLRAALSGLPAECRRFRCTLFVPSAKSLSRSIHPGYWCTCKTLLACEFTDAFGHPVRAFVLHCGAQPKPEPFKYDKGKLRTYINVMRLVVSRAPMHSFLCRDAIAIIDGCVAEAKRSGMLPAVLGVGRTLNVGLFSATEKCDAQIYPTVPLRGMLAALDAFGIERADFTDEGALRAGGELWRVEVVVEGCSLSETRDVWDRLSEIRNIDSMLKMLEPGRKWKQGPAKQARWCCDGCKMTNASGCESCLVCERPRHEVASWCCWMCGSDNLATSDLCETCLRLTVGGW